MRQANRLAVSDDPLSWLLKALIAALLVARLLVPTEISAEGDTLWIVQLWLAAILLWAWSCIRNGDFRLRVGWFDLFLWIFIIGHVVSAAWIFIDGGNKRAAVNIVWEWVGLGVTFFLVRQVVRTRFEGRHLALAMVATAAVLAGLGLWQHYYFYPVESRKYEQTRNELNQLEQAGQPATADKAQARQLRLNALRKELTDNGIPLEGPERLLWESRLRASSEPFGLFALANSFAGLLLVWGLVAIGFLASSWKQNSGSWKRFAWPVVVALILFCIVLTKSRTALFGLAIAGALWGVVALRGRCLGTIPKKWMAFGTFAVLATFAVASLSGGFDRKVVSESFKSLSYRMEYWTGTWRMLCDRPMFGAGPGNFRQHYLTYKLAESSEEVSDPHNLLLDVWSSGGLLALCGLAGMIVVGFRQAARRADNTNSPGEAAPSKSQAAVTGKLTKSIFGDPFVLGAGGGFALVWGFELLVGQIGFETYQFFAIPTLLLAYLILVRLLDRALGVHSIGAACFAAAGFGLLCHLLGAGGIEMPAIAQILLILPALAVANESIVEIAAIKVRPAWIAIALASVVMFVACMQTATRPVFQSKVLLDTDGMRNFEHAEAAYRKAALIDPLSPEPPERLADVEFARWQIPGLDGASRFENGVELQQLAIRLDPYSSIRHQKLARRYHDKFRRTLDKIDAEKSVEAYEQAVALYPASSMLQAELAVACQDAGQIEKAQRAAQQAVRLDDINHRAGHRDKYLPDSVLQQLQSIPAKVER